MTLTPTLPLSLHELVEYYHIAVRECEFLMNHLHSSLSVLETRMKPSPLVSVQFNKYEAYYISFLTHLKWRISDICIDQSLEFDDAGVVKSIQSHVYKHSGISHPIGENEITPMLESLDFVKSQLEILVKNIEASMLKSIFLCHASEDKPMARHIARVLTEKGSRVWLDEAEILVGDSILEKIQEGINKSDYLGIMLSPRSLQSIWVKKEVEAALAQEIESDTIKVLPILIDACEVSLFLRSKKYADLSRKEIFNQGISDIIKRLTT